MTSGKLIQDLRNEFLCQINQTKSNVGAAYYFTIYLTLDEREARSYTVIPSFEKGEGKERWREKSLYILAYLSSIQHK